MARGMNHIESLKVGKLESSLFMVQEDPQSLPSDLLRWAKSYAKRNAHRLPLGITGEHVVNDAMLFWPACRAFPHREARFKAALQNRVRDYARQSRNKAERLIVRTGDRLRTDLDEDASSSWLENQPAESDDAGMVELLYDLQRAGFPALDDLKPQDAKRLRDYLHGRKRNDGPIKPTAPTDDANTRIKQMIVEDVAKNWHKPARSKLPFISTHEMMARLRSEGYDTPRTVVANLRSDFWHTLRVLYQHGWLSLGGSD